MTRIYDERRKEFRVQFETPLEARVMAIDGTSFQECLLIDLSESGARITLASPAPELTEFFLVLSSFGPPVFRRCRREWVDGPLMGVSFLKGPVAEKALATLRREAELV
jgi:PilZ domain